MSEQQKEERSSQSHQDSSDAGELGDDENRHGGMYVKERAEIRYKEPQRI